MGLIDLIRDKKVMAGAIDVRPGSLGRAITGSALFMATLVASVCPSGPARGVGPRLRPSGLARRLGQGAIRRAGSRRAHGP